MDWFLYDNGLRHERVKVQMISFRFRNSYDLFFRAKLLVNFTEMNDCVLFCYFQGTVWRRMKLQFNVIEN